MAKAINKVKNDHHRRLKNLLHLLGAELFFHPLKAAELFLHPLEFFFNPLEAAELLL